MANTHEVLQGVKDYTLELIGEEYRDVAVDAAARSESAATRSEGAADSATGDAAATAADRVATGEDRAQTGEDREAAEGWAGSSQVSAAMSLVAAATVTQYVGDGFPGGKVAAPVGSIYTDRQATAGAVRWIKTSGTGTTGWEVEYGNTGWRNVEMAGNGNIKAGEVVLQRSGNVVAYTINNIEFADSKMGNTNNSLKRLPPGFRAVIRQRSPLYVGINASSVASFNVSGSGYVNVYKQAAETGALSGTVTYTTIDPWPSTLPGVPV